MPVEKYSGKIVDAIGNIERFIGISFAIGGSLSALVKCPTSGDSTGLGAGLSATELAGSLIIGGILFYSGCGLLTRSQMSRRIQIGIALIIGTSASLSLFSEIPSEPVFEAISLSIAIAFLSVMFHPRVRHLFTSYQVGEK